MSYLQTFGFGLPFQPTLRVSSPLRAKTKTRLVQHEDDKRVAVPPQFVFFTTKGTTLAPGASAGEYTKD